MKLSLLVIFIGLISSCTTVHYRSSGKMEVTLAARDKHEHRVEAIGHKEFYLWGKIPNDDHTVMLDKVLWNQGLVSAASLNITEYQTLKDMLVSWITLGMYIPIRYKIVAFGIKSTETEFE
ncbi:MAG: hypothetical protein KC493_09590 [Bacteriovoracaceae bacterium]|nr:hypothetical protein [Bacteriovoracaceae bacterium]